MDNGWGQYCGKTFYGSDYGQRAVLTSMCWIGTQVFSPQPLREKITTVLYFQKTNTSVESSRVGFYGWQSYGRKDIRGRSSTGVNHPRSIDLKGVTPISTQWRIGHLTVICVYITHTMKICPFLTSAHTGKQREPKKSVGPNPAHFMANFNSPRDITGARSDPIMTIVIGSLSLSDKTVKGSWGHTEFFSICSLECMLSDPAWACQNHQPRWDI